MKAAVILISYLLGSIPWALVIGKVFYHKDIRKEGSGNLGASNAGRVLGKKAAVAVTLLDALKAFFSMLIASVLAKDVMLYAGLACCVGHCFPVFAQFKGGKAVATAYGFFFGIAVLITHSFFWNLILPVLCFFATLYLTKIVSLSSLVSILLEAAVCLFVNRMPSLALAVFVLWLFILYRHRSNLERIRNGTENKVKWMG